MFFVAVPANAKCKFNVDTVHSRTGEKVLWTKWNTFTLVQKGDYAVGSGVSIGARKYFALRIFRSLANGGQMTKEQTDSELVIPSGGKLLLKLDDNSILELHTEEEVIADVDIDYFGVEELGWRAEAIVKYPVDASTLNALLSKRIMNMRLQTSNGDIDYSYGKKGAKRLQKTLACIH
jgi:hypothetical protein